MKLVRVAVLILLLVAVAGAQAAPSDAAQAFQKMSKLVGSWDGRVEWTGARTGTGTMHVEYSLTGYGSALVENLSDGGPVAMTSVYHLDNADLRVTHYCGAKNQPRLKANSIDLAKNTFDFALVDVTNVKSMADPFVHGVKLELTSPDQLVITFLFEANGKKSWEHIALKRAAAKS
jgi:hypothetical protein